MLSPYLCLRRWLTLPGDTPEEVTRKSLWTAVAILYFVISIPSPIRAAVGATDYSDLSQVAVLMHAVVNLLTTPYVLVTRRVPRRMVQVVGFEMLLAVLLADFESMFTAPNRPWVVSVVLFEFMILIDLPFSYIFTMNGVVCLYLFFVNLENFAQYGLRDLVSKEFTLCSCETPPCAVDMMTFVRAVLTAIGVAAVSVSLVNRFARDLKMEKRSVEASVELAGKIATALSRFDVALAEETIEEAVNLPSQLRNAFSDLVSNLKMYRPYLPDSCFPGSTENSIGDSESDVEISVASSPFALSVTESASIRKSSIGTIDAAQGLARGHHVLKKKVTLMVAALPLFLQRVDVDVIHEWQSKWISACFTSIHSSRGILDEFNGDKVVAVFNGAKACVTHAASALKCSLQIAEEATQPVSIAVMTARAICGDLGTAEVRRYSVVGGIQQETRLLQHLGWEWGYQVLCTESTFLEAPTIQGRLLIERVQFSGGAPTHKLYEVLRESDVAEEEWMYQLQSAQSGTLSLCNKATELAQDGDFTQALSDLQEAMPTVTGEYADLLATAMRCIEGASGGKQTLFKVGPLRLQGDTAEEPRESTPLVNSF